MYNRKKMKYSSPDDAVYISIGVASPESVMSNSFGEVTSSKLTTVKGKTFSIDPAGLESEIIFGPTKDYSCRCGKLTGPANEGKTCPFCEVLVTTASVRHERMGHMVLKRPIVNPLFADSIVAFLGQGQAAYKKLYDFSNFIVFNKETGLFDTFDIKDLTSEYNAYREIQKHLSCFRDTDVSDSFDTVSVRNLLSSMVISALDLKRLFSLLDQYDKHSDEPFDVDTFTSLLNSGRLPFGNLPESPFVFFGSQAIRNLLCDFSHYRYDAEVYAENLNAGFKDHCAACRKCYSYYHDGYEHSFEVPPVLSHSKEWDSLYATVRDYMQDIFVMYNNSVESMAETFFAKMCDEGVITSEHLALFNASLIKSVVRSVIMKKQSDECFQCNKCLLLKKHCGAARQELLKPNIRYYQQKYCAVYKDPSVSKNSKKYLPHMIAHLNSFIQTAQEPAWLVFTILPVPPAGIRPSVLLDESKAATVGVHDTTTLLKLILDSSLKLGKDFNSNLKLFLTNYHLLQHNVEALFFNNKPNFVRPVTVRDGKLLTSYSKVLSGKHGMLRNNCLGKRVDFSGRSVICVGPNLKMSEAGIPKVMLLELLHPFLIRPVKKMIFDKFGESLSEKKVAKIINIIKNNNNEFISCAKYETIVYDALANVIADRKVILNRAPSLHKLSLQAFDIVMIEGKAIRLNPLVCAAYNADFDGDQMAVHLPLSVEAQAEAALLLDSRRNLLKPADGKPVATPSQDMVLGAYYLTLDKVNEPGEGKCFRDENEVELAFDNKFITYHSRIKLLRTVDGERGVVETTYGKIIVNRIIPQDLGYVDRSLPENKLKFEIDFKLDKKKLADIIERSYAIHGDIATSELADNLKDMGYKYSTLAGFTFSVFDAHIPEEKAVILSDAEEKVQRIYDFYDNGYLSESEKSERVISLWSTATEDVSKALIENFRKEPFNPIWMMVDSGARGSAGQLRQITGSRGLIANASGKTIEVPIRSNYREGLTGLEYFTSGKGARKGFVDTALRTADSGYLTRRLVELGQNLAITEHDCGDTEGFEISSIKSGIEMIESLSERLVGRYLLADVELPDGTVVDNQHTVTKSEAALIADAYSSVRIRSVLTCKCPTGICTKCYGTSLSTNRESHIGDAVGVIAAQSIGEPGTQLTMRTFHTGGAASEDDITQGLPRIESLFEARRSGKTSNSILAPIDGKISLIETVQKGKIIPAVQIVSEDGETKTVLVHNFHKLLGNIKDGAVVKKGDALTVGPAVLSEMFNLTGVVPTLNYFIQEVQTTYRQQGVDVQDKHIEVLLSNMVAFCEITSSAVPSFKVGASVDLKTARLYASVFPDMLSFRTDYVDQCEILYSAIPQFKAGTVVSLKDVEALEKSMPGLVTYKVLEPDETVRCIITSNTMPSFRVGSEISVKIARVLESAIPGSITYKRIFRGASESASQNAIWLTAAGFQKTFSTLRDNAIMNKVDPISDLMSSVIVGKKINVGTGSVDYNSVQIESVSDDWTEL